MGGAGGREGVRRICGAAALDGHASIRFELRPAQGRLGPIALEGFALRDALGVVRGYLNVCSHRGQPVDVGDGRLFAGDGTLECQAHGARFDPASGRCVSGPGEGGALKVLPVEESDGAIWLREEPEPVDDE